jgi:hypothetical protein
VEEVSYLQNAWQAFQLKQQMLLQEAQASQQSYAQTLKNMPKLLPQDGTVPESIEDGFSEVLQTCVVPSSGSLGGCLLLGPSQALVGSSNTRSPLNTTGKSSPTDSTTIPKSTPALLFWIGIWIISWPMFPAGSLSSGERSHTMCQILAYQ